MSLIASFVALGVILILIPLKKAPKVFSYALWAVVLFKLLSPFTIEGSLSLIPVKAKPVPQNIIYSQTPSIDSGIPFVDNSINQAITNIVPRANPATSVSPMQVSLFVLSFIWIAGTTMLLLYGLVSYFRLKHRLCMAIPVQGNYYETDRIKTAFVLGFMRPKVYVPVGLSEKEIDYIIKHEQTHIRRRDYLVKPLAFIAVCVHWFNPLIWFSYFLAIGDMELSCDESVLKHYGSDIRREYSNSLLSLSAKQSGLISPLAFGETGVKERIKNVLKYKKPAFWVSIVAITAVIVAAILLLPNAAQGTKDISEEQITLEYSDESGSYEENYIKKTTGNSVTLLTEDSKEIISGEDVIPLPYVYAVKTNGKYDLLDKKALVKVSSISYDEIFCQKYPDGRLSTAIMKGRSGKYWGLISAQGKTLTNPQSQNFENIQIQTYEEVWPIIAVIEDGNYGAIDYKGKMVIKAEWDYLAMDVYNVPNTVFVFDGSKWGGIKLDKNIAASAVDYNLTTPEWLLRNYNQMLLSKTTVNSDQLASMFDFAIKYRLDYVPFFVEGNAPQSSSEYLFYAFAISLDNWGEDKGTMTKTYVENVIKTHFEVKDIVNEALEGGWNYDGKNYTAVPMGIKDKPIYVLTGLKVSTKDGRTVYEATMNNYGLADRSLISEEDLVRIKAEIIGGNYSSLGSFKRETFRYYFKDNGEPVFIAHILTDRPEMKWFYQMFKNDAAFKVLGSKSGDITDNQMATYAISKMDNYSYENGNTKEEYNAITQKYFGRNIKNFNNGATETILGTDKIRATGWSYDNGMYVIVKDVYGNGDGSTTGDFYCVNIPDSYWTGKDGEFEEAEKALLNGDISSFSDCNISIKRVIFGVEAENGKQYFKYRSVKNLEENVKSILLYSK
jgi:beta-lactamase regulating signal transducer with metallopeptidase domain